MLFELEPCGLDFPDEFDTRRIVEFVQRVKRVRHWRNDHTEIDVLALMHLGRLERPKMFIPNIACALLFANDPRAIIAGCRIRFLRFDGDQEGTGDRWNAIKDIVIDGTLPDMIEEADRAIAVQVRTFSRLGENQKFYTQPEYPQPAWYEAIVNACVHRSYGNGLRSVPIFVKMFDDRLVVESPGQLPPFVTPENI